MSLPGRWFCLTTLIWGNQPGLLVRRKMRSRSTNKRKQRKSELIAEINASKKVVPLNYILQLFNKHLPKMELKSIDKDFHLVTKELLLKLIKFDHTEKIKYRAEVFDCDNLAGKFWNNLAFMGVSSCLVFDYSAAHATNALPYLVENKEGKTLVSLAFFDPKMDKLITIGSKGLKGEQGFVLV